MTLIACTLAVSAVCAPPSAAPVPGGLPPILPPPQKLQPFMDSWPQQFELLPGEHSSFGFVASQPGMISVRVQAQGVPIIVSLSGPLPQLIQQPGAGMVALDYNITPADVARGSLWQVQIRPQGAPAPTAAPLQPQVLIFDQKTPRPPQQPRPISWGTIGVQHPPGDLNRLKAESSSRPPLQPATAQPNVLAQQILAQRKTQYLQAVAASQAAQRQQLQQARPTGALTATQPQNANVAHVTGPANINRGQITSAGSLQVITPPPPPPPPAISSMNVFNCPVNSYGSRTGPCTTSSHGQPGDSVTITGTGFDGPYGTTQVHFVVGPAMDYGVTLYPGWGGFGGYLGVQIPDVSGAVEFDGQIYVQVGGTNSAAVPFHFIPTLDIVQLKVLCNAPDSQINNNDFACPWLGSSPISPIGAIPVNDQQTWRVTHQGDSDVWGHKAEDKFYVSTLLKDGWVVDSVVLYAYHWGNGADASVQDSGVGTTSPYVDVHWWTDAFSTVQYDLYINLKGPKGLPYQ